MANLTGDFDVIAQFAVPAVNRILAAMHRTERFQHTLAMRVDDTSRPGREFELPTVVGVRDVFGDSVADHSSIRNPRPINLGDFLPDSAEGALASRFGAVANLDLGGFNIEPVQPSNLKGKAQVQLFPPTIELNDPTGGKITVRMELISRYMADLGSPPVAEFIRGDLRITAAINQVVSQSTNIVSIDVKNSTATVNFTPKWSNVPISAEDLMGINKLIRNALKTGFLPSSATLPSNIGHVQFKTFSGSNGAVAVLLDMAGPRGNPASANQKFLAGSDGFAFGIGADYLQSQLKPILDNLLAQQIAPFTVPFDFVFYTAHAPYVVTLHRASIELHPGKIVLVIGGHANSSAVYAPNFNFVLKQNFTLAVSGSTAELVVGDFTISTDDLIANVFNFFGKLKPGFVGARDQALAQSNAQATVRNMLDAEQNLGGFLRSLLTPAHPTQPTPPLNFTFTYTSAEIREGGIALHGTVGVPAWPPPRVEYEPIPSAPNPSGHPGLPGGIGAGPDLSAFKSWIPGGTVDRYEWHRQGAQGFSDANHFILFRQGPTLAPAAANFVQPVSAYTPMCLTVHGTRLTADGAVASEPVSATVCGYRSFPVGGVDLVGGHAGLLIALSRRASNGMVEVVGHASPRSRTGAPAPNLVVHFIGDGSADTVARLIDAVRESGRTDAPTAILAVTKPGQISSLPFSENVAYTEDDASWRGRYDVKSNTPATLVLDPAGKVAWRSEGPLNAGELSAVLAKVLVKTAAESPAMLTARARIGQPAPNFLFEHAPGQVLPLSKLSGKPVVIVFFHGSSQPSLDAVRAMTRENRLVLAVGDGARAVDLSPAIVVQDRGGRIATAYGVTMWPTIVSVDEAGITRGVAYGRPTAGEKSRV